MFVIAAEPVTPPNPISSAKVYVWFTASQKKSGYTSAFTNVGNMSVTSLFNVSGKPTLLAGDVPKFTIIPRVGVVDEYLAITYIKTTATTGRILYYVLKAESRGFSDVVFAGPYYAKDNLGAIASFNSAKAAIAIERHKFNSPQNLQTLYIALDGIGIHRFTIGHQSASDNIIYPAFSSFPTPMCTAAGGFNITPAPGSNFSTSELELSNNGNFLAWGDNNGAAGGTGIATVNILQLTAPRVVKQIQISNLTSNAQIINGLEFNPHYNPTAGVNVQLYVTAGTDNPDPGKSDGLFKVNVPASGTASVTSLAGSSGGAIHNVLSAQSQIELDYNGALVMINKGNLNAQLTTYLPESASQAGEWHNRKQFKATDKIDGVYRLPRQVDGWDYKFNGTLLSGTQRPVVANGGCTPVTVQRTVTYSIPTIDPASVHSGTQYILQLIDLEDNDRVASTLNNPLTYTFPAIPGRTYELQI